VRALAEVWFFIAFMDVISIAIKIFTGYILNYSKITPFIAL